MIPYAFIRFANEAVTLEQSLQSILGYCDRGILGYSAPLPGIATDESLAIATKFCQENPGFKLVRYPVPVIAQACQAVFNHEQRKQIDRYHYLDCYYNYIMIHLIELAKANGDYDQACLFKVDADHVYSIQALEYAHQYFEERIDTLDMIFYSKFNVSTDILEALVQQYNPAFNRTIVSKFLTKAAQYSVKLGNLRQRRYARELAKHLDIAKLHCESGHAGYAGMKVTEQEAKELLHFDATQIQHGLFNSYATQFDHFMIKLNKIETHDCLIEMGCDPVTGENKRYYWERLQYHDNVRFAEVSFASSYHFNREKYYTNTGCLYQALSNPESDTSFFDSQLVFRPFQTKEVCEFFDQAKLNDGFWTQKHLLSIIRKFNYAPTFLTYHYSLERLDLAQLINNPVYKLDNYMHELEQRLRTANDSQLTNNQIKELEHELHCLQLLREQYTIPVVFKNHDDPTMEF